MTVTVTLQFFDGCPSWQTARERLVEAARQTGVNLDVRLEQVETLEDAERLGFTGSPTLLVDGTDMFPSSGAPAALACRVYRTPAGLAGSPATEQLAAVLAKHAGVS